MLCQSLISIRQNPLLLLHNSASMSPLVCTLVSTSSFLLPKFLVYTACSWYTPFLLIHNHIYRRFFMAHLLLFSLPPFRSLFLFNSCSTFTHTFVLFYLLLHLSFLRVLVCVLPFVLYACLLATSASVLICRLVRLCFLPSRPGFALLLRVES